MKQIAEALYEIIKEDGEEEIIDSQEIRQMLYREYDAASIGRLLRHLHRVNAFDLDFHIITMTGRTGLIREALKEVMRHDPLPLQQGDRRTNG